MPQETLPAPVSLDQAEAVRQPGEQGTGVKADNLMTELGTASNPLLPDLDLSSYKGKEGSYNINNGVVCAVLPEGKVVSAPLNGVMERFITDQGLAQNEALSVVGSSGEFYEGSLGDYARGHGRDHKLGLALVADAVEQTSVQPDHRDGGTIEGEWLSVAHDEQETTARLREVGHYGVNNGVLAFVDGWGEVYVGPSTPERETALLAAGYTADVVSVPLSNGEQPSDENQRQQWEAMMKQAAQERQVA